MYWTATEFGAVYMAKAPLGAGGGRHVQRVFGWHGWPTVDNGWQLSWLGCLCTRFGKNDKSKNILSRAYAFSTETEMP